MPFVQYRCEGCRWLSAAVASPPANCFQCGSAKVSPDTKSLQAAEKISAENARAAEPDAQTATTTTGAHGAKKKE